MKPPLGRHGTDMPDLPRLFETQHKQLALLRATRAHSRGRQSLLFQERFNLFQQPASAPAGTGSSHGTARARGAAMRSLPVGTVKRGDT